MDDAIPTPNLDAVLSLAGELRRKRRDATDTLANLTWLAHYVERAQRDQVTILRHQGASWSTIGSALNTTKQAAQQRYGAAG